MFGDNRGIFDELTFDNEASVFGEEENLLGVLNNYFSEQEVEENTQLDNEAEQEQQDSPDISDTWENDMSDGLIFNDVDEESLEVNDQPYQAEDSREIEIGD